MSCIVLTPFLSCENTFSSIYVLSMSSGDMSDLSPVIPTPISGQGENPSIISTFLGTSLVFLTVWRSLPGSTDHSLVWVKRVDAPLLCSPE